jgi:hypothetical protein
MAKSIEQILGYVYLTGLVEDIKTGVPDDVLPAAFWTTKTETLADQGRYTRFAGTRRTPRRAEYGASSHRRELQPIGSFDVKLLHLFEHVNLDVRTYQSLRAYTDYKVQRMGMEEVTRQALLFKQLFDNARVSAVASMLSKGAIWWDADGDLLASSSGASLTVDYGISAANQNQLGGIITASWALAATDIPMQLRNLRKRARGLTGYPLKYAFYGANIPSYFANNTHIKDYLSRNPQVNKEYLDTGELPDLFGFKWVPAYEQFTDLSWGDQAAANTFWWGDDAVVFAPEITSAVYALMEGTYPVPKTFQPVETLQATMNAFELKTGMFAYGVPIHDPMTARLYAGDTFLPVWLVPDALFIADTTP